MTSIAKPKYDNNYLISSNGCQVTEQSSQRERGPASSIISSDPKSVWVTSSKLPQQCTISLRKINKKPTNNVYNMIGFYCWHQYDSNPALIQLWAKMDNNWQLISKIRLSLSDTWQYFKIDELNAQKLKQIKIRIMENFGDNKTYLNKIALHYVNPKDIMKQVTKIQSNDNEDIANYDQQAKQIVNNNQNLKRNKIHSEYNIKDNQILHKQLRKANDRIFQLSQEQQKMKKTMLQQQKIIIKIQQTLKSVLINMEKMQNIQQLRGHANQLTPLSLKQKNIASKQKNMKSKQQNKGSINKINYDYNDEDEEQDMRQQNIKSGKPQKQIQYLKKMLNKLQKQTQLNNQSSSKPHSTHVNKYKTNEIYSSQVNDIIKTNSQQDLSEFSSPHNYNLGFGNNYKTSQASQTKDIYSSNASKKKGVKAEMLQKLQKLLQLKQKKKLQLKKSAGKINRYEPKSKTKRSKYDYDQRSDQQTDKQGSECSNSDQDRKFRKKYDYY